MAVSDYSTTPASNTSISGINIAENCSPGTINNALRQMCADIRVFYDGVPSASTYVAKTGGVFTGQPTFTGRGAYAHHNNSAYTSFRVFVQASGGATPSGMTAGDVLLEY